MRNGCGLKLFLGVAALMYLGLSFAVPLDGVEIVQAQAKERVGNIFAEYVKQRMEETSSQKTTTVQAIEQQQISALKNSIERSRLLALMLELESRTPAVAKQLTTVSLFHEMKSVNHSLSQILAEMKKTNQLMQQLVMRDMPIIKTHSG